MSDYNIVPKENEFLSIEISDEMLEAAGSVECFALYTQFAYCTQFACPALPKLDLD